MERVTFKSVSQGNVRYAVTKNDLDSGYSNTNNFYHRPSGYVGSTCFQYDTLGDGEVQHTPEYLVGAQNLEDFMVSLALYISENHCPEMLAVLEHMEPFGISEAEIKFLYDLKPGKNGKPVYINLNEMKRTTADKQYDTRWKKLASDYEPTFKNIYPYFVESFHGFLARILIAEKIREATNWSMWLDYEESFGIKKMNNIRNAISILQSFLTAYRKIDYIDRSIDCLKHNLSIEA